MVVMGFKTNLIDLIMKCESFSSFSILVNGIPKGIVLSIRLWQGNPLSPYLSLLCTKGLIYLLKRSSCELTIPQINVCRMVPSINHLLFVDDNVLFCKADVETTKRIQKMLAIYEEALGQCINSEKTIMLFCKNNPQ